MGYFQDILDNLYVERPYYPKALRRFLSTHSFNKFHSHLEKKFGDQVPTILSSLPEIEGNPPTHGNGPVLFAVADLGYFQRFANIFLTSAAKRSPESAVHLHIIGATASDIKAAEKFLKQKPQHFGLTFERAHTKKMDEQELARFCQCMRFIRLESFVTQSKLEYIAFDIDSIVRKSFSNLGAAFQHKPIGLIRRRELDPTRKIAAGVVYVRPSPQSKIFLEWANRIMLLQLEYGPFTTMLDQRCLAMAMEKFPQTVFAIPRSIYSFNAGEGYVYSAKGIKKNEINSAFLDEEINHSGNGAAN